MKNLLYEAFISISGKVCLTVKHLGRPCSTLLIFAFILAAGFIQPSPAMAQTVPAPTCTYVADLTIYQSYQCAPDGRATFIHNGCTATFVSANWGDGRFDNLTNVVDGSVISHQYTFLPADFKTVYFVTFNGTGDPATNCEYIGTQHVVEVPLPPGTVPPAAEIPKHTPKPKKPAPPQAGGSACPGGPGCPQQGMAQGPKATPGGQFRQNPQPPTIDDVRVIQRAPSGQVSQGDVISILFSESMSRGADDPGASFQLRDADGTIVEIQCGENVACELADEITTDYPGVKTPLKRLQVMYVSFGPTFAAGVRQIAPGTTLGLQYPATIINMDSRFVDLGGTPVNLSGSKDVNVDSFTP
jgi:hypothetical protein